MEAIISNLVSRFEKGLLSRRKLVRGLAVLAASGTASAQEGLNFSAATIDRMLAGVRASAGGRRRTKTPPGVRRSVAVRTFADWDDPLPGFLEVDLVQLPDASKVCNQCMASAVPSVT